MKTHSWRTIREDVQNLSTSLRQYAEYLKKQQENSRSSKSKLSFVQTEREGWHTYPATMTFSESQEKRYGTLHDALLTAGFFEPICLNNYTPDISWQKYEFFKGLIVPCKAIRYTYTGGYENLDFAWRVPNSYDDAKLLSENIKVREKLSSQIPIYHSRAMKREFVQSFGTVTNCKPSFLRKAYQ